MRRILSRAQLGAQPAGTWLGRALTGALISLRRLPGVPVLLKWLSEMMQIGTAGYPEDVRRRLMIVNCIAYLIGILTVGYVVQYSFADYERYKLLVWLNVALTLLAFAVPLMHRFGDVAGGLLVVTVEFSALFAISALLGRSSGAPLHYLVAAAAPFVIFGRNRIWITLATVVAGLLLHLVAYFMFPPERAWIVSQPAVLDPLYTQAVFTTGGLIAASIWYAFRLVEQAKAETDAVLHNVLPASIVERLKHDPELLIADEHADVSVIFTDISGFVALSMAIGPAKVVRLLNDIVREFDQLANSYGVEKIKTIGDAYMAVSGVPEAKADHAGAAVQLACDMLRTVERIRVAQSVDLKIRIGIATGPVLAGVIGTGKFSYDVWGDTVNLASRLEGAGKPGRILVSDATYRQVRADHQFETAGKIRIRGQGEQTAWFVKPSAVLSDQERV